MLTHGISHLAVFNCVWEVVYAVNNCPKFDISYPTDHAEQQQIADGFRQKSKVGFSVCAGAIDGMLLWTQCPSQSQCDIVKCGPGKFFCARKWKYGINMQAVCDSQ